MPHPRIEESSELLDIKQAAALLNVSEVSLRRWTNAGKLACMRVGGKRERRFRREDLLEFLEGRRQQPAAGGENPAAHIVLEGMTIDYGSHLCALYESDLGRLKLAVPYLTDGLRKGDVCWLVAAREAQRHILSHLGEVFPGLTQALADGRLNVSEGASSTREMHDSFEQAFILASRTGDRRLRVLGDMAWALHKGIAPEALINFEMRFDHLLAHRFPLVSLCQYDTRAFNATQVLRALKCHEDTYRYPLGRFLSV